jgi:hypothetical protein
MNPESADNAPIGKNPIPPRSADAGCHVAYEGTPGSESHPQWCAGGASISVCVPSGGQLQASVYTDPLMGNTAEAVLDSLNCDVLIVKPAQFVSGVPSRRRAVRQR